MKGNDSLSTAGAETIGYPYRQTEIVTLTSHHTQKLIQNVL